MSLLSNPYKRWAMTGANFSYVPVAADRAGILSRLLSARDCRPTRYMPIAGWEQNP